MRRAVVLVTALVMLLLVADWAPAAGSARGQRDLGGVSWPLCGLRKDFTLTFATYGDVWWLTRTRVGSGWLITGWDVIVESTIWGYMYQEGDTITLGLTLADEEYGALNAFIAKAVISKETMSGTMDWYLPKFALERTDTIYIECGHSDVAGGGGKLAGEQ